MADTGAGQARGEAQPPARQVTLFATCLVDHLRPSVGFAAARLLVAAGCTVTVPEGQTCCGQPAYNGGARADARAQARHTLGALGDVEAVVVPSGSCAGMIRRHYPQLLADDPTWGPRAAHVAARTYELTAFLSAAGATPPGRIAGRVAYHDSCSCLREMDVRDQPRELLAAAGATVPDVPEADACCGFGGTFAVKYGDISADIAARKADALQSVHPDVIAGADLGCLINIAGTLSRRGAPVAVRHVAELLAGPGDTAPIGRDRP
jgi:L-lactate dehydrogenase complex protein LldE